MFKTLILKLLPDSKFDSPNFGFTEYFENHRTIQTFSAIFFEQKIKLIPQELRSQGDIFG